MDRTQEVAGSSPAGSTLTTTSSSLDSHSSEALDDPGQRHRRRQGGQLSTGVMGQYRTGVDSRLRVSGEALAESC